MTERRDKDRQTSQQMFCDSVTAAMSNVIKQLQSSQVWLSIGSPKHVFVHLVYSLYMIYDILSRSFVSHTVLYMLHSHVTLS